MSTDDGVIKEVVVVDHLGSQGDGVGTGEKGEVFLPNSLPGERIRLGSDGKTEVVGPFSSDRRRAPLCSHFPRCGGCSAQHMNDDLYRLWKGRLLGNALAQRRLQPQIAPMRTVPVSSRRRATFTGRWLDGQFKLGFHAASSHVLEPITDCAVLRPVIVSALPGLSRLGALLCRKDDEARVQVLAAKEGLDVTITTGVKPKAMNRSADLALFAREAGVIRLTLNDQPALQWTKPTVELAGISVSPPPGAFLQASSEAETILAELVVSGIGKARRVADLFAGIGTLSFAIAKQCRVLAVDADTKLLEALTEAHQRSSGLKPIDILRRDLIRDPLSARELDSFDAVVIDPPRSGAKAQVEALVKSKINRVVMVSCNPATLARDLEVLVEGGFALGTATSVDQFVYSAHIEAVAVLVRPKR